MVRTIFITGIGTGIGKTVIAAIVAEALEADYWKPVQAGDTGTDAEHVSLLLSNRKSVIHSETYKLKLPASPHLAAALEGIEISLDKIALRHEQILQTTGLLVVEGAGGLLVPLNEKEFVPDLVRKLNAAVILVSRNYLGSINHSLLTARVCRQENIPVLGWIFNGQYMDYENDIVKWSGFPKLGAVGTLPAIDKAAIRAEADLMKESLQRAISF